MYKFVYYEYGWWFACDNCKDLLDYSVQIDSKVWKSVLQDMGEDDFYNWDKYKNVQEASMAQAILSYIRNLREKIDEPLFFESVVNDLYFDMLEEKIKYLLDGKCIFFNSSGGWNMNIKSDIYEYRFKIEFSKPSPNDIHILKVDEDEYEVYLNTAHLHNDYIHSFRSYSDAEAVAKYIYLGVGRRILDENIIRIVKKYAFI